MTMLPRSSILNRFDTHVALLYGVAGLFAHYCLSNAFRAGEASLVVPLDFLRIPLIALVGWWFYAEPLDIIVFAGAGLIVIGIVWNLRSEVRRPLVISTAAKMARTEAARFEAP